MHGIEPALARYKGASLPLTERSDMVPTQGIDPAHSRTKTVHHHNALWALFWKISDVKEHDPAETESLGRASASPVKQDHPQDAD